VQSRSLIRTPSALRIGIVGLAVVASVAGATSSLAYSSPYSPLIVGAAIVAAAALVAWLRRPAWSLYALLFVVLLPVGLLPSEIQSNLNRTLSVLALATWLVALLARRNRVQWPLAATFMLGFLAWSAVTLTWTDNVSRGTTTLQTYALRLIVFLFLIPNEIRTRRAMAGLMSTLALSGWALVLVSVGTILVKGYAPGTRLDVLGENENNLGILALLTMLGVLWLAIEPGRRHAILWKSLALIFVAAAVGLVAASGSRGSAISLVITLLAFCLWRPTRPWGVVGLLIVAVGALLVPFVFSTTLERFGIVRGDTLLGGREALWQAAWQLILDHPWGGVGIGNARFAVMPYALRVRSLLGYEWAAVHNPVLTVWAETGIVGILLYLGVLGSALWSFARGYRQHRQSGTRLLTPYFALLSCVFLGYMASWIKGGGIESDSSYFLLLALLLVPSSLDSRTSDSGAENDVPVARARAREAEVLGLPKEQ
jgi:putative inorganic carbon (HCO3(-)) transporter